MAGWTEMRGECYIAPMARNNTATKRMTTMGMALILASATILGLARFNELMDVRYQAVGRVVDQAGRPLAGVRAILRLEPPPPDGPQLDGLFARPPAGPGQSSPAADVEPVAGLSDATGAFLVRATGRLGPAHAIRMGLDSSGKPPFETGWLVLRRPGHPDMTRTVSLLGWAPSPKGWGTFANRLPTVTMPTR